MSSEIETLYKQSFGTEPQLTVSVPGRVNLIGEHTDYNGGYVLPVAIPKYLTIAGSLVDSEPGKASVASVQFPDRVTRNIDEAPQNHWSDYVIAAIQQTSLPSVLGVKLFIESDIPKGTVLSSSAALMVAVIKLLENLLGRETGDLSVARKAQAGENTYIDVPCGIMDQLTVSLGKVKCPVLLNCATLEYHECAPLQQH